VGQPRAQADVGDGVQREEEAGVDQRGIRDLLAARRIDGQEADARERRDPEQVPQLPPPGGPHGPASSICFTASRALEYERRLWSNRCCRVCGSSAAYSTGET